MADFVSNAPTLLENFQIDRETFIDWFADAATQHDDMTIGALQPLILEVTEAREAFVKRDGDYVGLEATYANLGRFFHQMVMGYMAHHSKEAEG